MTPRPLTSFLSITPLEPVLVFSNEKEAQEFRAKCNTARILHAHEHPNRVYLPLPHGLDRVYTATGGDVGYEFHKHEDAKAFNISINEVGSIFNEKRNKVFLGKKLK
jgi:hypothetical protein